MAHDFSPIKKLLLSDTDASLHRQVFILAGSKAWQDESLQGILSGYEDESLWLRDEAGAPADKITSLPVDKAKIWLGNEKRIVIFDANKEFDADSFAAITGIIVGGGLLFLLLPHTNTWNEVYSSYFGQRLLQKLNHAEEFCVIEQNNDEFEFIAHQPESNKLENYSAPFLTLDQQDAVESITKNALSTTNAPIVLISDRGRGKSAALGIAITTLLKSDIKNIAITAPRLDAANIVFKHIAELLPESEVSKGCVKHNGCTVQFYSPDNLNHGDITADALFVDEAAAIPVPLLISFLNKHRQCFFATTVHGYEGTGRGFALRFFKTLDKYNKDWIKLSMEKPIRWAENDPLEQWMFDLLCLDAELTDEKFISNIDVNKIEYSLVDKEELVENKTLLNNVFSLLVLAHYRTRPKDLKSLLDDENITLYIAKYNDYVVSVSLVIKEGCFSSSLSTDVYRGKRRPVGHMLAQTLTYHCGIEQAATFNYSRVMRIAVHPSIQHKGIGTKLLQFIINNQKENNTDAIGTSFGMNIGLLNFWQKLKFNTVRIGFTQEQTSGEHAAVMLLPLSSDGENIFQEAIVRFNNQLPYWFDDVLKYISLEIKSYFKPSHTNNCALTDFEKADIQSYIKYSRNYELCIAALNKLVSMRAVDINSAEFPEKFRELIIKKVTDKSDWKDIAKEMALSGKKAARESFHEAIVFLYKVIP